MRKSKSRSWKNIFNDDLAVSNVVSAIMIMGFLISIFSVVYAYYVPDMGSNLEAKNIRDIKYKFSSFTNKLSSSISKDAIGEVSTMDLNLGTDGYILGTELESYGEIEFSPNSDYFNLTSSNGTVNLTSSGGILYKSQNLYYENAEIYFKWGMNFVAMSNANGIISEVPFKVEYHNKNIYLNVLMIDLTGEESSTFGKGSVSIKGTVDMIWNLEFTQKRDNIIFTINNANDIIEDITFLLSSAGITESDYNIVEDGDNLVITFYQVYQLNIVYASVSISMVV